MTDKEEKIIKNFKDILEDNPEQITLYSFGIQDLRIIVRLIEKQKKEIENLKNNIKNIIDKELPDDEICKYCELYDVNGITIKKSLKKLLNEIKE